MEEGSVLNFLDVEYCRYKDKEKRGFNSFHAVDIFLKRTSYLQTSIYIKLNLRIIFQIVLVRSLNILLVFFFYFLFLL